MKNKVITASGALDCFGGITDYAWKNSSNTDIVRIKHGYDRVGNRLYREDIAATNAGKSFDELYSYDGVNQLIDMQRGTLNTAKTGLASGKNWAEQFTFDATGNFANYKQDATGDGTFELNQSRVHNKANEIASIAGATTHTSHDANGNMTKCVKPSTWAASFNLVYDAWNRLVTVKDGSTVVASYQYDALNRRVKKVVGSETRTFYFNNQWQCLEEYIGSSCDVRYVWGLRYIDDLVTYRKGSADYYSVADPNWNVVAIVNTSGVVQ
jgi:YD repeat-containing protein